MDMDMDMDMHMHMHMSMHMHMQSWGWRTEFGRDVLQARGNLASRCRRRASEQRLQAEGADFSRPTPCRRRGRRVDLLQASLAETRK